MPSYRDLGPTRLITATLDTTLNNTGNWTIVADEQTLNCKVAQAEVYQIGIDGPVGSSFKLYRNTHLWNAVNQGWQNSYDPTQPLFIRPGDSLFFYWTIGPPSVPVPTAKIWLKYDTDLIENKYSE